MQVAADRTAPRLPDEIEVLELGGFRLHMDAAARGEYRMNAFSYDAAFSFAFRSHADVLKAVGQCPIFILGCGGCWQYGHAKKLHEEGVDLGNAHDGFSFYGNLAFERCGTWEDCLFIINLHATLGRAESLRDILTYPLELRSAGTLDAPRPEASDGQPTRVDSRDTPSEESSRFPLGDRARITLLVFDTAAESSADVTLSTDSTVQYLHEALLQLELPSCAKARGEGSTLAIAHDGRLLTCALWGFKPALTQLAVCQPLPKGSSQLQDCDAIGHPIGGSPHVDALRRAPPPDACGRRHHC